VFLIGLSGGIGTGKSEVARLLGERGAAVIRADDIARELVEPGTDVFLALVAGFGESVVAADGTLDRRRLAGLAFGSEQGLRRLNEIVHPPLVDALIHRIEAAERERARGVLVIEAALLAEWDILDLFDLVLVIHAPLEARLERLARGGLSRDDALARVRAQLPEKDLLDAADAVIENDGPLARLAAQVDRVWQALPIEERETA
jgi:dephospho-CoA kinase